MNMDFRYLVAAGLLLVVALPSSEVRSQLALPPVDPLAALETMHKNNEDLLKRQEATLKDLTDLTEAAREIRIYSKRG
jgi:hypothetical protein